MPEDRGNSGCESAFHEEACSRHLKTFTIKRRTIALVVLCVTLSHKVLWGKLDSLFRGNENASLLLLCLLYFVLVLCQRPRDMLPH